MCVSMQKASSQWQARRLAASTAESFIFSFSGCLNSPLVLNVLMSCLRSPASSLLQHRRCVTMTHNTFEEVTDVREGDCAWFDP